MGQAVNSARHRRSFMYFFLLFAAFSVLFVTLYPLQSSTTFMKPPAIAATFSLKQDREEQFNTGVCPDVLTRMTRGSWQTRYLTYREKNAMLIFLVKGDARYEFPTKYQRNDGKCGNVTQLAVTDHAKRMRALCDPLGMTPCCHDNMCKEISEYQCVCDGCIDIRLEKFAEFSTWVPADPGCNFKKYTPTEACRLLKGSILHLVGDSFLRHLHTAMLMVLSGDHIRGAFKPGVSNDIIGKCSGFYMFTENTCRHQVNYMYWGCGGSVEVHFKDHFNSSAGNLLKTETFQASRNPHTMLILGNVDDENYSSTKIQRFLTPLLMGMKIQNRKWPKLLWAEPHAPGMTLMEEAMEETTRTRKWFNSDMEMFLHRWDVPIFKTYNLTDGVSSFDGEHYGLGVNIVKANLLLNYIDELQRNGHW